MMFLLRAAFWVGVVLIFLPTGATKPQPEAATVGAADAAAVASAAFTDLSGFCQRQHDACITGSKVALVLGHRAEAGVKMIYQFLAQPSAPSARQDDPGSQQATVVAARSPDAADKPDTRPATHSAAEETGSIPAVTGHKPARPMPRPRPIVSQDTLSANDRVPSWRSPALRQEARLRQPG